MSDPWGCKHILFSSIFLCCVSPRGGARRFHRRAGINLIINTSRPDYSIGSGAHGAFLAEFFGHTSRGSIPLEIWCGLGFDSPGDMVRLGVRFPFSMVRLGVQFPWRHGAARGSIPLETWCGLEAWTLVRLVPTAEDFAVSWCRACARIHANSFLEEMQFLLALLAWGLMTGFLLQILKAQIVGVLGPSICQPCYRCPSLWLGRNSLLLGRLVAHSPAALSRGAMPEMFIAHLRSLGSLARARVALMAA